MIFEKSLPFEPTIELSPKLSGPEPILELTFSAQRLQKSRYFKHVSSSLSMYVKIVMMVSLAKPSFSWSQTNAKSA